MWSRHHSFPIHVILWLQCFRTWICLVGVFYFCLLNIDLVRINSFFFGSSGSSSEFICSLFINWIIIFNSTFILVVSSFWCSMIMVFDSDSHSSFELNSLCWSVNLTFLHILTCPLLESQIRNLFFFLIISDENAFFILFLSLLFNMEVYFFSKGFFWGSRCLISSWATAQWMLFLCPH